MDHMSVLFFFFKGEQAYAQILKFHNIGPIFECVTDGHPEYNHSVPLTRGRANFNCGCQNDRLHKSTADRAMEFFPSNKIHLSTQFICKIFLFPRLPLLSSFVNLLVWSRSTIAISQKIAILVKENSDF